MIASSNETLMAFAACQILELRPRLLPVPGSTPLPPVLRLRLSALPPVSRLDTYKAAIVPALRARPAEMENEQGNSPKRSPAMDERGGSGCWSLGEPDVPERTSDSDCFTRERATKGRPQTAKADEYPGGLLLTIFLDYLPLGVPEDDIVARFTCIRRPVAMATGIYFSPSSSHRDSVSNLSSGALPCFPSSAMWRANSSGSYRSIRRRAWGLADAVKAQPGMARLDTSALELSSARYTVNLRGPQPAPVPEAPSCQRSIDDSFGSLHEMMLGRVRQACSYFDGGSGGLRSYMLDELEMEPDFSYSVFVPAKIVTVKRDNAEEERGVGEQHGSKTKGKQTFAIQCVSPRLEPMVLNDFDTFIDVGLNGVHFTERPKSLRVVDIHILGISPDVGSSDRRTRVQIEANECFESENTVVLLRYPDATEDVLPAHVDTKSHRISFWMPPKKPSQRLPTGPGKDPAGVIDEVSKFSTEPVVSDEASGGHNSPIAHEADGGFVPSNQVDHKGQISVFLSFNGQVFSRQPAVFTYYSPDLCTQHVIAYTISENGDLFDVDLDNVMSPQTHIVVSVQSAIASNSAQVRLTILRSGNPAARDFLSCLHDEMSPVAAVSSSTDTDNYTPSTMSSAHEVASPPEQAVERVLYLPAVIDVDPQPLTLLPDPNRVKRKPAGSRATDSQRGKAGSATANSAGARAKTKAVPGGGAGIPGMANFTGGGQEGKTPAVGLGGPREQTGSAAGRNATSSGGPTLRARRREKAENSGLEAADEKPRDPTLTFVTPELTFPALTLEEEQVETSEDFVFAVCSVSLDGQRFIPVNEARILRLQCIRLRPSQEDAVPAGGGGGDGRTSSPDHVKPRKKGLPPE
ncbi:hypothetical protein TGME49_307590 [Toxoplasma gondii ME49]|uniref:Uncharacterized protein n=1 Tax=Toxoplasma gondii (strain ATCC 50611 / Me49) TaxID=508771 RepID=S8GGA4_TOXGM|nr:hypothetical protein TGME49_307590 [Toxoplasma gondii ME49]EPT27504.1 hypothetical protein TGME49_307590 [Toxoplasma gondii ME49]|eukprot:XP_018636196.1 hypothetical protein TGME49_307590 [Toxoplasma gondii ME49]